MQWNKSWSHGPGLERGTTILHGVPNPQDKKISIFNFARLLLLPKHNHDVYFTVRELALEDIYYCSA